MWVRVWVRARLGRQELGATVPNRSPSPNPDAYLAVDERVDGAAAVAHGQLLLGVREGLGAGGDARQIDLVVPAVRHLERLQLVVREPSRLVRLR